MWNFDANNTFCISLESSTGRRQRMEKRFEYFGMDVSFCRAAYPSEVTETFIDYMSPGQRACAQSHINVWRYIWEKQLPYALILEDDAMFDLKWREKMDKLWWILKDKQWDAVFLNCSEPVKPKDTWVIANEQFFTGAYVVSLEGVRNILHIMSGLFSGIVYSSDWTTSRLQELGRSWTYFPWLVIQEGHDSLIGSGVELDHLKVVRCLDEIGYNISENYT
jgi:GR25 family glycosyltransferase involved in LPS biosynthesis